jgi:hypothetical protein
MEKSGGPLGAAWSANPISQREIKFRTFVWIVLLLVGLGIVRSAIATRLYRFTIGETYHIVAGVSQIERIATIPTEI